MASITINFTPPSPAPSLGYDLQYRVVGAPVYQTTDFATPPVVLTGISEENDYEGIISFQCQGQTLRKPFFCAKLAAGAKIPLVTVTNEFVSSTSVSCSSCPECYARTGTLTRHQLVARVNTPCDRDIRVLIPLRKASQCEGVDQRETVELVIPAGQIQAIYAYISQNMSPCASGVGCGEVSVNYTNTFTQLPEATL